MNKERRLGRGLEALLGRAGMDQSIPPTDGTGALATQPENTDRTRSAAAQLILHKAEDLEQAAAAVPASEIATAAIDPNPWQPRSEMSADDLVELANSLKEHGLVQPIVIRKKNDRFQLIAGQRRLAAARRLGWENIPVRLLEVDDRQMSEIAIVENLQRRDLDPLEKATSFKQYLSTWGGTQDELAKRLSVDRSTVANLIRLLELPEVVQQKLRGSKISMGHARALIGNDRAIEIARRAVKEQLSVRQVEKLAREDGSASHSRARHRSRSEPGIDADIEAVQTHLEEFLGMPVKISTDATPNTGSVTIRFRTLDQLDLICQRLTGGDI